MNAPITFDFVGAVLLTAVAATWLARRASDFHLIDRPQGRKRHAEPTPVIGGLAMTAGIIGVHLPPASPDPALTGFVLAAGIVVVAGVLDDMHDVQWWWRISAQMLAALVMIHVGGVQVEQIGRVFDRAPTSLGALSVPVTIVATVGVINAMNMADGSDGLAGSLAFAAVCMIIAAALYVGNESLAWGLVPVLGAILVFLWFNMRTPWRSRAAVFMGNAGSSLLGFTIVWATFRLTQHEAHVLTPVLAPWFLAPPIIDCLTLIVRRIKAGKSPFHADRGHMHHLLQDAGFTPIGIVLLLTSTSFALGLTAAVLVRSDVPDHYLVVAFIALTLAYYWLTSRRQRSRRAFAALHAWLCSIDGRPVKPAPARMEEF